MHVTFTATLLIWLLHVFGAVNYSLIQRLLNVFLFESLKNKGCVRVETAGQGSILWQFYYDNPMHAGGVRFNPSLIFLPYKVTFKPRQQEPKQRILRCENTSRSLLRV